MTDNMSFLPGHYTFYLFPCNSCQNFYSISLLLGGVVDLRQGELVIKNPKKLPINILLTGLLVIAQEPDLHPTK